jgi:hypothetical protein
MIGRRRDTSTCTLDVSEFGGKKAVCESAVATS